MDKINTNGINISGLDTRVNSLEIKLDESQQRMSGMNQEMYKMKAESDELEIKESVAKVMESMLNYVESSITKDKMDKMGKFDLNSMRESIITLQEQITILSDTTVKMDSIQNDIQKLYEETNTLKNKPKSGDDIKLATIQMLNNVEFENIYSILNSGNLAVGQSVAENVNYSEMMENKINGALEKIKNDNEKMWINIVNMKDKVTDPEEIKKIIEEYTRKEDDNSFDRLYKKGNKGYNSVVNMTDIFNNKNSKESKMIQDIKKRKYKEEKTRYLINQMLVENDLRMKDIKRSTDRLLENQSQYKNKSAIINYEDESNILKYKKIKKIKKKNK